MRIVRLYLENFKGHKKRELFFDYKKNLIIGENGTGKSSIFHAIIVSLFGFERDSLSWVGVNESSSLIRHLSPSAKLILEIEDKDGRRYSILRTISSSGDSKAVIEEGGKVISSGSDQVNKKIKELLRIDNINKILNVLYIRQGDLGRFISLSGKSGLTNILEELFDIKTYSNYLDIVQGLIRDLNKELEYLEREKYSLSRDIEEFSNIFGGMKVEDLDKVYKEYTSIKKRREELYEKYRDAKILYSSIDSKLISQERFLSDRYKEMEEKYNILNQKLLTLKSEKNNLKYNKYSEDFIKKSIEELEKMLKDIEEKIKDLDRADLLVKLNNLTEKSNLIKEFIGLVGVEEKYNNIKNDIEEINNRLAEEKNKVKNIMKIIEILEGSKEKNCPVCRKPLNQEEVNALLDEYRREMNKLNEDIKNIESDLLKKRQEIKEMEQKYIRYKYINEKLLEYNIPIDKLEDELNKINSEIEVIRGKLKLMDEYEIINGSISYLKLKDIDNAISKISEELNNLSTEMKEIMKKISSIDIMKKNLDRYNKIMEELGFRSLYDLENEIKKLDEELKKYENFKPELYKIYLEKLDKYNSLNEKIRKIRKNISLLNSLQIGLTRFIEKLRQSKTVRLSEEFRRHFRRLYRYEDIIDVRIDLKYGRNRERIFDIVVAKNVDGKIIYKNVGEAGLSGGQTKILDLALRLSLASIINPNFKVLMLDEPTESLDENVRFSLAELLDSLEGYQIILCTHDELFKEKMSGTVVRLDRST